MREGVLNGRSFRRKGMSVTLISVRQKRCKSCHSSPTSIVRTDRTVVQQLVNHASGMMRLGKYANVLAIGLSEQRAHKNDPPCWARSTQSRARRPPGQPRAPSCRQQSHSRGQSSCPAYRRASATLTMVRSASPDTRSHLMPDFNAGEQLVKPILLEGGGRHSGLPRVPRCSRFPQPPRRAWPS